MYYIFHLDMRAALLRTTIPVMVRFRVGPEFPLLGLSLTKGSNFRQPVFICHKIKCVYRSWATGGHRELWQGCLGPVEGL
jgi:hypothetical protein